MCHPPRHHRARGPHSSEYGTRASFGNWTPHQSSWRSPSTNRIPFDQRVCLVGFCSWVKLQLWRHRPNSTDHSFVTFSGGKSVRNEGNHHCSHSTKPYERWKLACAEAHFDSPIIPLPSFIFAPRHPICSSGSQRKVLYQSIWYRIDQRREDSHRWWVLRRWTAAYLHLHYHRPSIWM